MFGRKKVKALARERIKDPVFHASVAGGVTVRIDYDASHWVRYPDVGAEKSEWVGAVLAAYAEDFGWSSGSEEYEQTAKALTVGVDQPVGYTATFLHIFPTSDFAVASLDVLDEEGVLLKYGDPEKYLDFVDLEPKLPPTRSVFLKKVKYGWYSPVDENYSRTMITRVYKVLSEHSPIRAIGVCLEGRRPKSHGEFISLAYRVSVDQSDPSA